MITITHIKSVRLVCLLACVLLLVLSEKVQAQGVDNPLLFELGATYKVNLFENEQNHLKISLPAGQFKAILDSRRSDGEKGNMTGSLSILSHDGVVTKERAIWFNYIDIVCRGVYGFSLKKPTTLILKLASTTNRQTFWLTVLKESPASFLPFFDEVVPKPAMISKPESGTLDPGEFVYYNVKLSRGDYRAILDFTIPTNQKLNIGGYFATLDEDGGNQRQLFYFNEIDSFSRKTGAFSVSGDTTMVFRVQNGLNPVNYKLTIQPAAP